MRISDWSSDVCSSDLPGGIQIFRLAQHRLALAVVTEPARLQHRRQADVANRPLKCFAVRDRHVARHRTAELVEQRFFGQTILADTQRDRRRRSEEHTSELQSLMRISYAVFCLLINTYLTLIPF